MNFSTKRRALGLTGPQALLGWSTLCVVLVSAIALGANRPASWSALAGAVFVLFGFQTLLDILQGVPRTAARVWLPALFFFAAVVWALVQTLPTPSAAYAHPVWAFVPSATPRISADPIPGQQIILRLTSYGMIFWLALRAATRATRAIAFLKAIALFSTAMAAFGLAAYMTGINPILQADTSPVFSATFINRNSYATFAVFGILANLGAYIHAASLGSRNETRPVGNRIREFLERFFGGAWLFALGFLLCLAGLVLTQSRGGALAGIVGLATFAASYRRRDARLNPFLLATLIGIPVFVFTVLTTGLFSRLLATTEEENRFQIYALVLEGIWDRPLLGHGLGTFENSFRQYVPIELAQFDWNLAHNSYLENAFELGLPAAVSFYLGLLMITFAIARGTRSRRRNRIVACVALSSVFTAGLHSVFDFSLQIPAIAALFAFILGIGYAQSFRRSESSSLRRLKPDAQS